MFNEGNRVRLMPFMDQPEVFGVIIGYGGNGIYTVQLDEQYWSDDDDFDDGFREVPSDQLQLVVEV